MKSTYVSFVLLSLVGMGNAWAFELKMPDRMPAPNGGGDYCVDEAVTWTKNRFGGNVEILGRMLDKNVPLEKETRQFRVHVWTDLCQDYFSFGYGFYGYDRCSKPQYYERTKMLWMAGGVGDCRRLMPQMEFPGQ